MPYKFDKDKLNIPKALDKRRKLTDEDVQMIRNMYALGYTIRGIARAFPEVSRRTIQFKIFPERLETVNFSGHWKKYYDKDKHREYMRKHRNYKKKLNSENLLLIPEGKDVTYTKRS